MAEGTDYDSQRMFGPAASTGWEPELGSAVASQGKGLALSPQDWLETTALLSISNESGTAWRKVLQAIRPCRESQTGWTRRPGNRRRGTKALMNWMNTDRHWTFSGPAEAGWALRLIARKTKTKTGKLIKKNKELPIRR